MDSRSTARPSNMLKRRSKTTPMVTITLKLSETTMDELALKTANSKTNNMSEIIEDTVTKMVAKKIKFEYTRKPHKSFPVKKTFTFTPEFSKMLHNNTSNMSAYVDTILKKAFQLE